MGDRGDYDPRRVGELYNEKGGAMTNFIIHYPVFIKYAIPAMVGICMAGITALMIYMANRMKMR